MPSKIEISHKTIVFTVAFLALIWLILQIRDILFLLFISFILTAALRPLVDKMEQFRVPRVVGIIFLYMIVFGFFGISLAGTIPTLVIQTTKLAQQLPVFAARLLPYWQIDLNALTQQIAPIGENLVKVTVGLFSNIITTLTVLVFTFYLLLERKHTEALLTDVMGNGAAAKTISVVEAVEKRLGAWVQGQLFLMFLIGVFVYIGLLLLHVEYALPLALIAGILEIVPIVGPIMAAIPAVLVALAVSPFLALSVVALYFIVQQIENHIVIPIVMRKSVGLSPVITITALMIGGRLAGMVGAILAVPVVLVLMAIVGSLIGQSAKTTKKPSD